MNEDIAPAYKKSRTSTPTKLINEENSAVSFISLVSLPDSCETESLNSTNSTELINLQTSTNISEVTLFDVTEGPPENGEKEQDIIPG